MSWPRSGAWLQAIAHLILVTSATSSDAPQGAQRKLTQIQVDDSLHPVIVPGQQKLFFIEAGDTTVNVVIDASPSHTHQPGAQLTIYEWKDENGNVVGSSDVLDTPVFGIGKHSVLFTITDNFGQSASLPPFAFTVATRDKVPGSLVRLYQGSDPATLPNDPIFGLISTRAFQALKGQLPIGDTNFILRMEGKAKFPANAVITFPGVPASSQPLLWVDGVPYTEGTSAKIAAGVHQVEFRCFMLTRESVSVMANGQLLGAPVVDVTGVPPIIHSVPSGTTVSPGETAEIRGFLMKGGTVLVEGTEVTLGSGSLATDTVVTFIWPSMPVGEVSLVVNKPGIGSSNSIAITYTGPVDNAGWGGPFSNTAQYVQKKVLVAPSEESTWVTRMVFCHGSVFASVRRDNRTGIIFRMEVDDEYNVLSKTTVVEVPQPMNMILGLACDPRDDDVTFKLYFSHSKLPIDKSAQTLDNAPGYEAAVSYVKPNDPEPRAIVPLIRNIGVSGHDHACNGLAFLHDGRLLIAQGGNTNAGIAGAKMGMLEDGPTVGSILVADIRNPTYNGNIKYKFLATAPEILRNNPSAVTDQRNTGWVRSTNKFIKPYIYGVRTAYAVAVSLTGKVSLTNNGPNPSFGLAMTGLDPVTLEPLYDKTLDPLKQGPGSQDALWIDVQEGCYLGHPNIALCRGGHQPSCKYINFRSMTSPPGSNFCVRTTMIESALTGYLDYQSQAFGGVHRDHFFIGGYLNPSWRFNWKANPPVLQADTASSGTYPPSRGIDFFHAPAGVHLLSQYDDNNGAAPQQSFYAFNIPKDDVLVASGNPSVYDIVPNKAAMTQTNPNTFVIGGENFHHIPADSGLTVKFGGVAASNVAVVGKHWIKGNIPSNPTGKCPDTVEVRYGPTVLTMPDTFCYLLDIPAVKAPPLVF